MTTGTSAVAGQAACFSGLEHLQRVLQQAQNNVDAAILPAPFA